MAVEGEDGGRVAVFLKGESFGLFVAVGRDGASLMEVGACGCGVTEGFAEALDRGSGGSRDPWSCGEGCGCHCRGLGGRQAVVSEKLQKLRSSDVSMRSEL